MASKVMTRRVESIVYATYRAMIVYEEEYAISATNARAQRLDLWATRYRACCSLQQMVRVGFSDTAINNVWDALRVETQIGMTLIEYGRWVRKHFPAPKTPKLVKIAAFEQRRSTQIRRAQIDVEIAHNQKLLRLLHPALA